MTTPFNRFASIAAALVIGGAGIFELIDQTSMIVLIAVMVVALPNARGCLPARGA